MCPSNYGCAHQLGACPTSAVCLSIICTNCSYCCWSQIGWLKICRVPQKSTIVVSRVLCSLPRSLTSLFAILPPHILHTCIPTEVFGRKYSWFGHLEIGSGPTSEDLKRKHFLWEDALHVSALHTVTHDFQKHNVPMLCPAIVPDLATPLVCTPEMIFYCRQQTHLGEN